MGTFSESMQAVGLDLITQFGNDCILTKKIVSNKVYNPLTDEYDGTDTSINFSTKYAISKLREGDKNKEENPAINKIATVPYSIEIADLDTTWLLDGNEIYNVDKVMSQNDVIIFKLYVG